MLHDDPLWYKDAIIYELHVRSFHDAIGDGFGDFRGLTQKLDYLQDLGVTAIWLLPFYPSPLKDDGYDIADYTQVNPQFGTIDDFQNFLDEAHRRGLRVITELVINHTSDQHPWFQRARRSPPGSPERDFYVWSDTPEKYAEARIIFKDFEHSNWTWDGVAKQYFWHRFYSHQPDLNYDNPAVWDAIFPIVDQWLGMGVDGLRLDAVPYLYEREGTGCENLPETHVYLKALRKHIDEKFPNRMLLSEANQWPEDAVAYFGDGDETHMAFHFPVMPRMFMAIHMEDRFPILDILAQTPAIPENCQWSVFLRNHDELTLEMVTDEERDYMYRAYASDSRARINLGIRHRLAPLLGNNRPSIELMNGLLFSLPGTPVLYYGDEIGMGDNIYLGDRNGVRTPMQWSADRNAGFSRANPQKLYLPVIIDPAYHYEAVNVEAQQNNPNSLLWWMKRLIALRKHYKAFGRGTLEFLHPANRKILAFVRQYKNENILVVANLSRFVQHVELDLGKFQGLAAIELFGRTKFPRIGRGDYHLALGPHSFYWFSLEAEPDLLIDSQAPSSYMIPEISFRGSWEDLFKQSNEEHLELVLPGYFRHCRWMDGDPRTIAAVELHDAFRIRYGDSIAFICLVEIHFDDGSEDEFVVPLTRAPSERLEHLAEHGAGAVVARLRGEGDGILCDAIEDPAFREAIVRAIAARRVFPTRDGELVALCTQGLDLPPAESTAAQALPSRVSREEQANTSILYGDRMVLKVFRRIEEGTHPEVEVGRTLAKTSDSQVAPLLGTIEFRRRNRAPITLAVLHGYMPHEGTAWQYTLDEISRTIDRVLSLPPAEQQPPPAAGKLIDIAREETPPAVREFLGQFLESVQMLGTRTADVHLALARETDDPAFVPEPFTRLYQRSVYQSMRNVHRQGLDALRADLGRIPEADRADAQRVLELDAAILERFRFLLTQKLSGKRIRSHGDLNLCEALHTGKDFVIIDFEGQLGRSLSERRIKRSPLRDVAGMIRSFHYAAASALRGDASARGRAPGWVRAEDVAQLEPWVHAWYAHVSAAYLRAYLARVAPAGLLPEGDELSDLLDAFLLEKALIELEHELQRRPKWVGIPLQGLLRLVAP